MARRTIRARRASPYQLYLVIVFALLVVVCAVGWAWTYNVGKAADEEAARVADKLEAEERLADQYRSEIHRLTERLMGDPFEKQETDGLRQSVSDVLATTERILDQAGQTLQKSYQVAGGQGPEIQMTSMQAAVLSLIQRTEALLAQIAQNSTAIGGFEDQIKGLQEELTIVKQEHKRQTTQLTQDLEDEKKRVMAARDSAIQASNRIKEELQRVQDLLAVERRQWKTQSDKAGRQVGVLQEQIKELTKVVDQFRTIPSEAGVDGRIIRVGELGSVAYGDLGKSDGILLGMTFSIFSADDLGKEAAQPKAQARVIQIRDEACELQVFQGRAGEPVVIGDVLHNPIYDRHRRLRFMLVGKMDLDGDGYDDSDQLKALVLEFGGRVDTGVTVQTDYLVVGEEPRVPAAPGPEASSMERQEYERAREAFIHYTDARAKAQSFSIPILSLNRFLGLVGVAGRG